MPITMEKNLENQKVDAMHEVTKTGGSCMAPCIAPLVHAWCHTWRHAWFGGAKKRVALGLIISPATDVCARKTFFGS